VQVHELNNGEAIRPERPDVEVCRRGASRKTSAGAAELRLRWLPRERWSARRLKSGRYEIYIDSFPEPRWRGKVRISTDGGDYPHVLETLGCARNAEFPAPRFGVELCAPVRIGMGWVKAGPPNVVELRKSG
jgi:hypothetical protein